MADFTNSDLGTVITQSDQSKRFKHTTVVYLLKSMFSPFAQTGTPITKDYNLSDLKPNQSTPIDGEKTPQHVIGNGRRPVYGQQYPRGYYNK